MSSDRLSTTQKSQLLLAMNERHGCHGTTEPIHSPKPLSLFQSQHLWCFSSFYPCGGRMFLEIPVTVIFLEKNAHCAKSSNIIQSLLPGTPRLTSRSTCPIFIDFLCFHATNQGELAWSQEVLELLESLEAEATRDRAPPSAKGCPAVSCGLKMVTMTSAWQITSCNLGLSCSLQLMGKPTWKMLKAHSLSG